MMTTYDIARLGVKKFWEANFRHEPVIVFFEQKYTWRSEWEKIDVVAYPNEDTNEPVFEWDFCEGQTDFRKMRIVYYDDAMYILRDIIEKDVRDDEPPEV